MIAINRLQVSGNLRTPRATQCVDPSAEYEVQVRVTVERGCQLIGSTRNAGIEPLGVLDFGRISRLDSGSGPLNAALLNQRVPRGGVGPHDGAGG